MWAVPWDFGLSRLKSRSMALASPPCALEWGPTRGRVCKACKAKFQLDFWLGSHLYCWLVFWVQKLLIFLLAVQSVALFLAICCMQELKYGHLLHFGAKHLSFAPYWLHLGAKIEQYLQHVGSWIACWQNLSASRSQHKTQNMSCIMFAVDWTLLFAWYL